MPLVFTDNSFCMIYLSCRQIHESLFGNRLSFQFISIMNDKIINGTQVKQKCSLKVLTISCLLMSICLWKYSKTPVTSSIQHKVLKNLKVFVSHVEQYNYPALLIPPTFELTNKETCKNMILKASYAHGG